ncbi:NADH-quinone oxidoreductase subunit N [Methylotetracoccus oryzae]|uniref:NADH-quinone oxidoreductase subunit N n=1 Tax=Methylotetracoccus oryzae TaxID=1919059 RepID=UPI00111B6809|nr:NADH-quinone oxidoreductase subunit N [Methylotetracoccus oryzae]
MSAAAIGSAELTALLPIVTLGTTAVVVLLWIAFRRNHAEAVWLTLGGLSATLLALAPAAGTGPRDVTGLLRIDGYALFFIALFCLAAIIVVLLARDYLRERAEQPEEFYLLLLTSLLGASVLAASTHFASFFLGLETLSISLFPLIAYATRDARALEAATKYLVLSGVASGFLLFGMALVYAETGSLAFGGTAPAATAVLQAGAVLILVGVGFKLSFFPFHLWTADVYQGAPAPVTALLATVSKGAVFAVLLRYGVDAPLARLPMSETVLGTLAGASMLIGNLAALAQHNLKRLLAYSSIAHMGYLLLAVIAMQRIGPALAAETLGFYLAAYTLTTLAAFGVMTAMSPADREAEEIGDYAGLFWTRPAIALLLTLSLLSLAGIPLTAGFIGKFYLFIAASHAALWPLLGLFVVGSGLGLYYYLRVIFRMAASVGEGTAPGPSGALQVSLGTEAALAFLGLSIAVLGLLPASLIDFLAAEALR